MVTRRQSLGLIASALATPLILSSRTPRVFAQDGRPVLRIAVQAIGPTLEPLENITNVGLRATDILFDRPLRRNFIEESANPGKTVIDPQLATSVERIDPLVWEMKLRPGVKFHDGTTLSANDIIATFGPERTGPDTPFPDGRILFGHITNVEKVDDLTDHD